MVVGIIVIYLSSIHTFRLNYLSRSISSNYGCNSNIITRQNQVNVYYRYNHLFFVNSNSQNLDNSVNIDELNTSDNCSITNTAIFNSDDNNYVKMQKIVNSTLIQQDFSSVYLHSLKFYNDRVEVILSLKNHGE